MYCTAPSFCCPERADLIGATNHASSMWKWTFIQSKNEFDFLFVFCIILIFKPCLFLLQFTASYIRFELNPRNRFPVALRSVQADTHYAFANCHSPIPLPLPLNLKIFRIIMSLGIQTNWKGCVNILYFLFSFSYNVITGILGMSML